VLFYNVLPDTKLISWSTNGHYCW